MALTTGTIAASATPAGDLYTQVATVLTNAGWVILHGGSSVSASDAGTTDIVYVWRSPNSTTSGTNYLGCILFLEVDNTNSRIRVRVAEQYDTAPAGTPALRVKWAADNNASGTSVTPSANYARTDSLVGIGNANNGYFAVGAGTSGFNYWVGANDTLFVLATNNGGARTSDSVNIIGWFGVAGNWDYLGSGGGGEGSVGPSEGVVFLLSQSGAASWTITAGSGGGSIRTSRDPYSSGSTAGLFCYTHNWAGNANIQSGTAMAGSVQNPLLGTPSYAAIPVIFIGLSGTTNLVVRQPTAAMVAFMAKKVGLYYVPFTTTTQYNVPWVLGDQVTDGTTTLTVLGPVGQTNTGSSASVTHGGSILVNGGLF